MGSFSCSKIGLGVQFICKIFFMSKLAIIDGNAIVHRAYHALPPMTTKDGLMVNAVYGFTSMLLKVWRDLGPDYMAVTFDMAGPTFRHEKYEKYKATRVRADQELYDQIPLVHEVVKAFGLPVFEKKGYEADDVIGTIAAKLRGKSGTKKSDVEIMIVTGDLDTLQLVGEGVKVYTLRKGMSDIVVYDEQGVKNRFGFGPEMMVDYKALRGDVSDNIPGVPGIGEKTAGELIKEIGSVETIYKKISADKKEMEKELRPSVLKKLIEGKESAKMSKELATIDREVPGVDFNLEDCLLKKFNRDDVVKLFQKFEFVSLLKRVPGNGNEKEEEKPAGKTGKKKAGAFKFLELKEKKEAGELISEIEKNKSFACRAVLTGQEILDSELLGLAVASDSRGYFIGIKSDAFAEFLKIFQQEKIELIGHDLKELVKSLMYHLHVEIKNRLFDAMIASYLLHPGTRAHDITSVLLKFLGQAPSAPSAQSSLFGVDKKAVAEELYLIMQTRDKLENEIQKADNAGLFQKVEMALVPVLAEMEINGIAVDLKMLARLSQEAKEEIKKVTDKIYKMAGMEFNIGSPIQLREVLFDKMGISIEGIKKGKTGLSTSAEELEKMRGLHPIIDEISNYRELAKLQNTYIDVLPGLINKKTGRIHTHFNQAVTATGRLSSSDPNLQNIPIRTELGREIRKAFVSEPGNTLISADYSQIELRIVASLADDKRMIEIFKNNEDIHKATAAAIHDVPLDKVTKEMRYAAKEINFGVLYGMGPYGLSWRAGISQAEAKDFINKYFRSFSGVRDYIAKTLEFTKKEGYCETLFGRRRYIPELNASNFQLRSAAERMAINHPIQKKKVIAKPYSAGVVTFRN